MYERFTDRARKVCQLANQEAHRLKHDYVGTEHLLLGLVKEKFGVASRVLESLGLGLPEIRREVEKLVPYQADGVVSGRLPQTLRVRKVLEGAVDEAQSLHHNYVGTEHLLLSLLRDQENVAGQILQNLGAGFDRVREAVLRYLSAGGCSSLVVGSAAPCFPSQAYAAGAWVRRHEKTRIFVFGVMTTLLGAWVGTQLDSQEPWLRAGLVAGGAYVVAVALLAWTGSRGQRVK